MSKRLPSRVLLLLALLASNWQLRAQDPQNTSPRELWPLATGQIREGKLQEAERTVDALVNSGRFLGIQRFPVYADSAATVALTAAGKGDKPLSEWAIGIARKLDPNSPDVEFAAADIAYRQSDWSSAGTTLFQGFLKTFSNYRARILAVSDLTLVVCSALAASVVAFALILFYRFGRPAAHDFRELLGNTFSRNTSTALAWALLILPIFLWFGPVWVVLYWMGLFYGYAPWRDRAITIVLLVLMMIMPVVLAWTAYRISGIDSPVLQAAIATAEKSMNPEPLRRLRELSEILPSEPILPLLMGDLEVQQANEREAANQYRRALRINPDLAGAHLNLGNLYFYENDFQTANVEYDRAASLQPDLAIAYYNRSVVSGELYKFTEQGQQIEKAKQYDRLGIERLMANPPRQKVVMYHLPVSDAWKIAEKIARSGDAREVYGNHAFFDPIESLRNPLTIGALVALIFGPALAALRRKNGFAGQCIKCGRTFCNRCKGSRESATYCTQCIYIYLKRNGVSLDTKKEKLKEVQDYQTAIVRNKKLFTTVLPGSGQLIDGESFRGFIALALFLLFVSMAWFIGRLAPLASPALIMKMVVRYASITFAVIVFLIVSISVYRQRVIT